MRPYHTERILGLAAHAFGDHLHATTHLREARRWAHHYGDRPLEAWILCELGEVLASPDGEEGPPAEARRPLLESRRPPGGSACRRSWSGRRRGWRGWPGCWTAGAPGMPISRGGRSRCCPWCLEGLTNEAIAARLAISTYTAANHVRRILDKTGTANRTAAASLARKLGLVE